MESVTGRIKDYDECIRKFQRKYLPTNAPDDSEYKIIDYLSDFIDIRITCFYSEAVNRIRKVLNKNFLEIICTNKASQREKLIINLVT